MHYVVYKITFPNGKIYIGSDTQRGGHQLNYFGSWSSELVEKDFTAGELSNFVIRKEILFESDDKKEVLKKEGEMIRELKSNEEGIGYNRTHKIKNQNNLISLSPSTGSRVNQ